MSRHQRPANKAARDQGLFAVKPGFSRSGLFQSSLFSIRAFSIKLWPTRKTPSPARGRSRREGRAQARAAGVCPVPSCGWSRREHRAGLRIPTGSGVHGGEDRARQELSALVPARPKLTPLQWRSSPTELEASLARAEIPARLVIRRSVRPLSVAGAACSTRFQNAIQNRKTEITFADRAPNSRRCALRFD
jgi:hypothetical protein